MQSTQVNVWDLFVRVFHWSLVMLFVVDYFTGEEGIVVHIYAGYVMGGLIVSRIVWGFIDGRYARFREFICSPIGVVAYVKSLVSGNPDHYMGHNPAGGYMILALLLMVGFTTITGLKVYGVEGYGPLAESAVSNVILMAQADEGEWGGHDEYAEEEGGSEAFWEEVHDVSANLTVLLILLHILGVVVSSRLQQENLVRAMVTGKKNKRSV
jgi:cytochrome b